MVIVVVLVDMPFEEICNTVGTGSEHTDRGEFLSGRTVSLHACATLSRRVHHNKLVVDRDFKKKHKNMFPILTNALSNPYFKSSPILYLLSPQLFTSLIEGKNCLLWINKSKDTDKTYMWVSVLWKTTNLKRRNLLVSHTLSWSWSWNT
jgi:hypothetical protein